VVRPIDIGGDNSVPAAARSPMRRSNSPAARLTDNQKQGFSPLLLLDLALLNARSVLLVLLASLSARLRRD